MDKPSQANMIADLQEKVSQHEQVLSLILVALFCLVIESSILYWMVIRK